jgi:polysaccharide biosynthesis transport protein
VTMLQPNKPQLIPVSDRGGSEPELVSPGQVYSAIEGFIRRQHPLLFFVLLLTLGVAVVYLAVTPPRYTSEAVIMIDPHKTQLFQQPPLMSDLSSDSTTIDTQLELLRSENIALAVVRDLHLAEVPEFSRPRQGFLHTILGLFTSVFSTDFSSDPPSLEQLTRTALGTLESRLNVKRVGMTYVIQIDFQSFDPERAAQVANAVADTYIADSLEAKYQATRQATVWLQDRLKELREQSSNAERAVVDFKAKNDIVETGTGGRLMNEQQLAELNTALIQARAQTAEARARLDRVEQILKSDAVDSTATPPPTVTDTLHNDVITRLRQQYLDLQAHESDWSKRFGPDHLAVVNVRNQMREIRHNIVDELERIAETYKSDYEIARTREESVQKSLGEIVTQSQTTNEAQVTLHSLESSALTYKSLYEHFLQRYMESVQQQSFPVGDGRVITQATKGYKSAPNQLQIIGGAAAAGIFLGVAIGLLREMSDRVFRTAVQVEEYLQVDCIAVVPLTKSVPKITTSDIEDERGPVVSQSPCAEVTESIDTSALDPALKGSADTNGPVAAIVALGPRSEPVAKAAPRTLQRDNSMLWATTNAPFSRFTESIRAIKVAADLQRLVKENKVIGITSSVPNEGKTSIAMVFAGLIGQSGKVALLDCDLRNPSLTRALAPGAKLGILDVISGKAVFDQVAWNDPTGKLMFMPAVVQSRLAHSSEILASDAMRKLFGTLRAAYDYVVVDLSPLAPVVDVRAMTHLVDSFVFVVEWGRTRMDIAEHALNMARGVHENLLGVVLNKVNMDAMWRFDVGRNNYYYNRYFARYGHTE